MNNKSSMLLHNFYSAAWNADAV